MKDLIIRCVLFSVLYFFFVKQNWSADHFTGAFKPLAVVYKCYGIIASFFGIYFLIVNTIHRSIIDSVIILACALIAFYIVNSKIICASVLKDVVEKCRDDDEQTKFVMYNRWLDINAAKCAFIGIVVQPILCIALFLLR